MAMFPFTKLPTSGLIYRWTIMNSFLIALFAVGYVYGMLDLFLDDDTYLTHGIIGVFVLILIYATSVALWLKNSWKNVEEFSLYYQTAKSEGNATEARDNIEEMIIRRLSLIEIAGPVLVALGLMGTVLGIRIGFSELGPNIVGDLGASQLALTKFLSGLGTAFNTTLVGITGMVWNMLNLHMLKQEASKLYVGITA